MRTLEEQLENEFLDLGISRKDRGSIKAPLIILRNKDIPTYEHSIRVGIISAEIARHMHLDPKVMFYAGVLHDIGKFLVPPEVLKKTEGFNEEDMKKIKKHPEYTYQVLRGIHEFSAEIALRHHRYQEKGYPKKLPKSNIPFSPNTKLMIDFFARILSLADFYDAISSRVNDKFGEKRKLTPEEVKSIILMKNPDQKYLINDLYADGIFGEQRKINSYKIL